jgi:hypothetical protein
METIIIKEFNIYGCELSTDIDVAFIIDDIKYIQLFKQNKVKINYDILFNDLTTLGYDLTSIKIDLNMLYIGSDGNLSMCLKGSKDVQNGIILTYDKHKQMYPCFFTSDQIIKTDIEDRIRGLSKFILVGAFGSTLKALLS